MKTFRHCLIKYFIPLALIILFKPENSFAQFSNKEITVVR